MNMKFFIIILCCMGFIEIKASLTPSQSALSTVLSAVFSGSRIFNDSELVSPASEAEPLGSFPRGSLLEHHFFSKMNQENIDLYRARLASQELDLEIAWQKMDSKLSELDEVRQKMNRQLSELEFIREEFGQYVKNVEARAMLVDRNIEFLKAEFIKLLKRIDVVEKAKVSPESLTSNRTFMNEVETMLARLLLERFSKQSVQTSLNDDDAGLPSGRASTCSYRSIGLDLVSSDDERGT